MQKRMYFLVPYQLSGRQGCIQAGHAALEYALKYGRNDPNHEIWDFIEHHKTFYVMNGGTVNEGSSILQIPVEKGSSIMIDYLGTMNEDLKMLQKVNYPHAIFKEPDLGDLMTCVCLICDERVFNKDEYPDFFFPNFNQWIKKNEDKTSSDYESCKENAYREFVALVGEDVAVLKNILNSKRFF